MRLSAALLTAAVGMAAAAPAPYKYMGTLHRRSNAAFTQVEPGNEPIMEEKNILRGTNKASQTEIVQASDIHTHSVSKAAVKASLNLSFVNNLGDGVNAYISGLDSDGKVVFVGPGGTLIYPASGDSPIPTPIAEAIAIPLGAKGANVDIVIPISLSSSRISFAAGELTFYTVSTPDGEAIVQPSISNPKDPSAGLNWGFSEFTLTEDDVLWTNISYVDWVGMILSLDIKETDGNTISVVGLPGNAVPTICGALQQQTASDNQPWASECQTGKDGQPLRVLSPGNYRTSNADAWSSYWSAYIDQVWSAYSSNKTLKIDTQNGDVGTVNCKVSGDSMTCDGGDNRPYAKPTVDDIFGCNSGPFTVDNDNDSAAHKAVVPRLCAAFNRGTLLLDGGDTQPGLQDKYYSSSPSNHYARIIHANEVDGKGYAFPYDDVNPTGANEQSGLVTTSNHDRLTFYVGGKQASA